MPDQVTTGQEYRVTIHYGPFLPVAAGVSSHFQEVHLEITATSYEEVLTLLPFNQARQEYQIRKENTLHCIPNRQVIDILVQLKIAPVPEVRREWNSPRTRL